MVVEELTICHPAVTGSEKTATIDAQKMRRRLGANKETTDA
jgi:hypothetical protein